MKYRFDFSKEKDLILQQIRNISFEEIIQTIEAEGFVVDLEHFNKKKYPNQRIYIVKVKNQIYVVPYVVDKKRKVKFLKTIYANRKIAGKYLK